jgi:hypothetical protein
VPCKQQGTDLCPGVGMLVDSESDLKEKENGNRGGTSVRLIG